MRPIPKFQHVNKDMSVTTVYKHDSYYATVEAIKGPGFVLLMELESGETVPVYAYGNYSVGDRVLVSVSRIYNDGRLPVVDVDSVITYAYDLEPVQSIAVWVA